MGGKLLTKRLPDPPLEYDREKMNQIVRAIEQALNVPVERANDAEEREALDFFLSN